MKNDGGSAFPVLDTTQVNNINSLTCIYGGMTLRDYFAGQVLYALAQDHILWFNKYYLVRKKRLERKQHGIVIILRIFGKFLSQKSISVLFAKKVLIDSEWRMLVQGKINNNFPDEPPVMEKNLAAKCYLIADAMLGEKEKELK